MKVPISPDERERLQALHDCNLLDTPAESVFDHVCRLASGIFRAPIAAISLLDRDGQFFKSIIGLDFRETSREVAFCAHTILQDEPLVVLDAAEDPRFSANCLVTGGPGIRFYCGVPLRTPEGFRIGSLSVIDREARESVPEHLVEMLVQLAEQVSTEVARRRTDQERLQASEEVFRGISSSCPVGIFHADLKGNVSYANPRVEEIWGASSKDLMGLAWVQRVHPEDISALFEGWTQSNNAAQNFEKEYRLLLPDGSVRWIHGRSSVLFNSRGIPTGTVGTVDDITARKQLEDEKNAQEQLTRQILESSADCIKVLDLEGRLLLMSLGGQRALGIDDIQSLLGVNYFKLWKDAKDRASAEAAFQIALGGGKGSFQGYLPGPNNESRWWDTVFSPILDAGGRPERILAISRDLTELRSASEEQRKAKELAEHANRAKSLFLANASHELRTPLNGVLGTVELLLRTGLDPEQREFVETVQQSGKALLCLVDDLLDLSRMEEGKLECKSAPFDIRKTVSQAVKLVSPAADRKGLLLSVDCVESLPTLLLGDEDRIRQILINYLNNALKFTDRGSVSVHLRSQCGTDGPSELLIAVRDTGSGIPDELQPNLFRPFSQVDESSTRRHGGLGLGLAICGRLAEAMGGSVGLESATGQGSTFWVRLPLRIAGGPAEKIRVQSSAVPEWTGPAVGLRVLVVEDNPINQKVITRMLTKLGCQVSLAVDGEDAVRLYKKNSFEVVLMDCQMPDVDGYEATGRIRDYERHRSLARTPILALTAHAMKGDRERCLRSGMDDHLIKPLSLEALRVALERWGKLQFYGTQAS